MKQKFWSTYAHYYLRRLEYFNILIINAILIFKYMERICNK